MCDYDPDIIEEYADRLYNKALLIQLVFAALGFLVPWWTLENAFHATQAAALTTGLLGLLLGWAIGRAMGFGYKLQAQMALCQVQIEQNTRPAAKSEAATAR